jgi:hypothetical protein
MHLGTRRTSWVVVVLGASVAMWSPKAVAQSWNADEIARRLQRIEGTHRGTNAGTSLLMPSELQMLQSRLASCWDVPKAVRNASGLAVTVRIRFNTDGSLARPPEVVDTIDNPAFPMMAESATRAVNRCAPFSFLPTAKYEAWKDVEVVFDPRTMFGPPPR